MPGKAKLPISPEITLPDGVHANLIPTTRQIESSSYPLQSDRSQLNVFSSDGFMKAFGNWCIKSTAKKFGRREIAQFELGTESEVAHYYSDEEALRLATSMANTIGIPLEEVWEAYGNFLIEYTMESGWSELLCALGYDLKRFLDLLNSLHYFVDHFINKTKMRGPAFCCEAQEDGSLILHYYSIRYGIDNIVKGVTHAVARRIFGIDVAIKVTGRKEEKLSEPVTYHRDLKMLENKQINDTDLFIEHVGHIIRRAFPTINAKTNVCDIMEIAHPQMQFSYESVLAFKNSHFIFQLKQTAEMAPALNNVKEPIFLKGPYIMQILLEFLRWPKLTQPIENPTDTSKGSKSVLSSRLSPYGLELFGETVDLEHGSRLASWVCF
ncbi:hypothetical protein Q1695_013411 [Nippostrongylus brasiliensis]|nr:hypothetical protein Q1695_013411 [Nippostrongylus brasiliensis]